MEQVVVSGVAADAAQVKFTLQNLSNGPGVAAKVFGAPSEVAIVVDIIVQDISPNGSMTLSFTVSGPDFLRTRKVLENLKAVAFPTCLISEGEMKRAVESLHQGFELHRVE
jgi:aspartate kinase